MPHDIHEFVRREQSLLQSEYNRIQARAIEDPGTAGDQGEENWAKLLRDWLPQYFHVVTKGRIINDSGEVCPHQLDVLILYPSYPRTLLDMKLYLSGGVAAAFECKTTLTAAHVKKAVQTSADLKRMLPQREGSPYKELNAGIIFGLLAHSHSWRGATSSPVENIEAALLSADAIEVKHPRECIDLITVADLATWSVSKMTYRYPLNDEMKKSYGPIGSAATAYVCCATGATRQTDYFSPIGALLSYLFSKLAWSFPDMRELEKYFRQAHLGGCGGGLMRGWDINIFSEKVRERILRGELASRISFDEWSLGFW